MFVYFIAFLAPFFASCSSIIECRLANNIFKHPSTMIFYVSLMNCVFIPLLFFLDTPTLPSWDVLPFYFGLAVIDVLYLYPFYKAMQEIDTSIVEALKSLGQITIPVMTYFWLDERLKLSQYGGFALIVTVSVILSINNFKMAKLNKAFYYMVLVSLLRAFYLVLQKYTFKYDDNWINMVTYVNFISFLLPFGLFLHKKSAKLIKNGFHDYLKYTKFFCINEFLCFLSTACAVFALSKLSAVSSAAINATNPIFLLLISLTLRKKYHINLYERISPKMMVKKTICFTLLIFGVVLVAR